MSVSTRLKKLAAGVFLAGSVFCTGKPLVSGGIGNKRHELGLSASAAVLRQVVEDSLKSGEFPRSWVVREVELKGKSVKVVFPLLAKNKSCLNCHNSWENAAKLVANRFFRQANNSSQTFGKAALEFIPSVLVAPAVHLLSHPEYSTPILGVQFDSPDLVITPISARERTISHESAHVGNIVFFDPVMQEATSLFNEVRFHGPDFLSQPKNEELFMSHLVWGLGENTPPALGVRAAFSRATQMVPGTYSNAILSGIREYEKKFLYWDPVLRKAKTPLPIEVSASLKLKPSVVISEKEQAKANEAMARFLKDLKGEPDLKTAFCKEISGHGMTRKRQFALYYQSLKAIFTDGKKINYGNGFLKHLSAIQEGEYRKISLQEDIQDYYWHPPTRLNHQRRLAIVNQRVKEAQKRLKK